MRREIVLRLLVPCAFLGAGGCCQAHPTNVGSDAGGDPDVADGQDLGEPPDAPDAPEAIDSPDADVPDGAMPSCAPQDVHDSTCVACDAYLFLGAYWDGRECFELWGCVCEGSGCASRFSSLAECNAAMAGCDASLCAGSGGAWHLAAEGLCGITCGAPDARVCFAPYDTCNCGPGRTFASGTGCRPDATCTADQTCVATGGTWDTTVCGFTCGVADPNAPACTGGCNCGPAESADSTGACVADPLCPPSTADQLCAATGGTWYAPTAGCSITCSFDCGIDPCGGGGGCAVGCDCGSFRNWDSSRGCVYDPACENRGGGQNCDGSQATCRAGLVCCYPCGIAGCTNQCVNPCCATSGACRSGCYLYP